MIRINLLPAEERVGQARKMPAVSWMVGPVTAAAALVMVIFAATAVQTAQIRSLEKEVSKAERETASLAPQIDRIGQLAKERADMDLRISLIKRLESSRYVRVQMLDEVSRQLPDHVWLSGVKESTPGSVQITGVTFSNLMVADFMQRLENSPLYEKVDLSVSEKGTMEDRDVIKFTLTAQVSAELGVTAPAPPPKSKVTKRES